MEKQYSLHFATHYYAKYTGTGNILLLSFTPYNLKIKIAWLNHRKDILLVLTLLVQPTASMNCKLQIIISMLLFFVGNLVSLNDVCTA